MSARTVVAPGQSAAGAGVSYTLPESVTARLVAVSFRIVTSVVVATRGPFVRVADGTGVSIATTAAGYAVTASSTADYTFAVGLGEWDSAGTAVASGALPPLLLDAGDSIVIGVDSIDVGDQISRVRIVLEQMNVRD